MKQGQIIHRFLLPADQNPPEAIHPAMGTLDHPSPGFKSRAALDGLSLLSASTDMRRISKLVDQISHVIVVVAFIQAQTLGRTIRRLWARNRNAFQGFFHHPHVMAVGPINSQTHRNTGGFTQHASFYAAFGSVRRIWPGFFPRPAGLWSWRHPSTVTTSSGLSVHRTPATPVSIISETRPCLSTPENGNEPLSCCKFPYRSMRSTGFPSVKRKRFRSLPLDHSRAAVRPQTGAYSYVSAAASRFSPTFCLKPNTEPLMFFSSVSLNLLVVEFTRMFISYTHQGLFG